MGIGSAEGAGVVVLGVKGKVAPEAADTLLSGMGSPEELTPLTAVTLIV